VEPGHSAIQLDGAVEGQDEENNWLLWMSPQLLKWLNHQMALFINQQPVCSALASWLEQLCAASNQPAP